MPPWIGKENKAFNYTPSIDYESDDALFLGSMSIVCEYCLANKSNKEPAGMCCSSGRVLLPELWSPPESLLTYLMGEPGVSGNFMKNIRRYNFLFQMTSMGGKICDDREWMPTFKVQGQVYHRIGSLLPSRTE